MECEELQFNIVFRHIDNLSSYLYRMNIIRTFKLDYNYYYKMSNKSNYKYKHYKSELEVI